MILSWRGASNVPGIDFFQSWSGAQLAPAGERFYTEEMRRGAPRVLLERGVAEKSGRMVFCARYWHPELFLVSTPALYTAFALLPGKSYDIAFLLYQALSILAVMAAVAILCRVVGLQTHITLIVLGFVLLAFQPLRADLRVANVNQWQLLMIALWAWLTSRMERESLMVAGAIFAFALCFKPNLLILLPLLIARRLMADERDLLKSEIAGMTAGGLATVVLSSLYFRSPRIWLAWLETARSIPGTIRSREMGNVAFSLPIVQGFGPRANLVLAAVLFAITLLVIYRSRRVDFAPHFLVGLAAMIYLLSAPLVWYHYLVLSLPLVIALLATDGYWPVAVVSLALIAADPLQWLARIRQTPYEAAVVNTGLVLLFAASLFALWRSASMASGPRRTAFDAENDVAAT